MSHSDLVRCYQVVSTDSQGLGVVATEPLLAGQLVTEEAMRKPWENHGKMVENHRKTIGFSWISIGKIMGTLMKMVFY